MRKISANYIFPVNGTPIKNGILIVDSSGKIIDLINPGDDFREEEKLEFYNGIIIPGFVNTHCHLELSHMKGMIAKNKGLVSFISSITNMRNHSIEELATRIKDADRSMYEAGISVVGDIMNSDYTVQIKSVSKIRYYNFIEVFGSDVKAAKKIFSKALNLYYKIKARNIGNTSIVPHAPYSLSEELFLFVKEFALAAESTISMHNQESEEENLLFRERAGKLFKYLENIGIDPAVKPKTGKNSLPSVISFLPRSLKTLLVHNTFSTAKDIDVALNHFNNSELYFAICPNSNLYIEGKLPDINMFLRKGLNLTIGTDSLASNSNLSVLEELKTLQNSFPETELNDLITWGTLNGARALNMDKDFGSFEPGKKPGVVLLENIDFENMKFTKHSRPRRLI